MSEMRKVFRVVFGKVKRKQMTNQDVHLPEYDLKIGRKLGQGQSGVVYLAWWRDTELALKKVRKGKSDVRTLNEASLLKKLSHPHIVAFRFLVETDLYYYIGMEYAGDLDLFDLVAYSPEARLKEHETWNFSKQIASAVQYLHALDIMHRDLKLENIIICGKIAKLTDFGLSKMYDSSMNSRHSLCGSLEYMAPEVLNLNPYGTPADIWSLGIVVNCMVQGCFPYPNDSKTEDFDWNDRDWPFPTTPECKALVDWCLDLKPKKRPTAEEVMNHAWFVKGEFYEAK